MKGNIVPEASPLHRYTGPAIAFHWLVGAIVIVNVLLALGWDNGFIADDRVRFAINWHKSLGILALGLAIMRLLWRMTHQPPPLPTRLQRWEIRLSGVTHFLLYAIIFIMPLSGWIMDSAWDKAAQNPIEALNGAFTLPRIGFIMALDPATKEGIHAAFGTMHIVTAYVLYVLFFLHVGGALKHQFVDREREIQRMLPGRRL